jgi:hypothetical protein
MVTNSAHPVRQATRILHVERRANVIEEYPEKAKELKALFDRFTGDKKN